MSKKSFARLVRIVTGTFGTAKDEYFSLETSLTRFEKFVHFWVLVWRSFVRNRCPVRASALSYTTLLALIPMLAVAMSVSSVFLKSKGEEQIKAFIEQFVEYIVPTPIPTTNAPAGNAGEGMADPAAQTVAAPADPATIDGTNQFAATFQTNAPARITDDVRVAEAQTQAASYIHQFIQNTYSGTLGTLGVVFLFWTAIAMLTRVEETFNDIWGVARGRDWASRISNYVTTIVLGPVLLITALGLASGPHFQKTRELITVVPFFETIVSQLLPVAVISITFALFYKLMPNTKVHFSAAFAGGALAGTAWHIFNIVSLHLASRAVNASRIYGGLALVPLMMLGLYAAWVMVLFGAQVAYAFQNRESYLQEKLAENVNQRGREFVALRLMTCIGQRFERGVPPVTVLEMSRELGIPSKLIQQVMQTLIAARLVVEVTGTETAYSPARSLDAINCHHILLAMRAVQGQELVTRDEPVRAEVLGEFARIQAAEKEAAASVSMLALVNRAHARIEIASLTAETAPGGVPLAVPLTALPNEPARVETPPGATIGVAGPESETTATTIEPFTEELRAPKRSPTETSTNEERDFPL